MSDSLLFVAISSRISAICFSDSRLASAICLSDSLLFAAISSRISAICLSVSPLYAASCSRSSFSWPRSSSPSSAICLDKVILQLSMHSAMVSACFCSKPALPSACAVSSELMLFTSVPSFMLIITP